MRSAARGAEPVSLDQAVNDLVSYADRHFSYEESVMEQAGYEHLAGNWLQRRRMRKQLDEFVRGLSNNSVTLSANSPTFCKIGSRCIFCAKTCSTFQQYADSLEKNHENIAGAGQHCSMQWVFPNLMNSMRACLALRAG
ncbi:MAG: hemerythrin family protein [Turneriella sp.]